MMFAFSRDGAVPGHEVWRKVSKRDRIPVYTVWAIVVLAFLTLPTLVELHGLRGLARRSR